LKIPGNQARAGEKLHPNRPKEVLTVLGSVNLKRSYFYQSASADQAQGRGRSPLDEALGLIDGYTPAMAKMMCRAGAMASGYEAAGADLKAYAGLNVEGRQIQRMVNLMADDIGAYSQKAKPFKEVKPVEVFYGSVDGTGVPMMPDELQGRAGKQEDGSSKTREVKLGCVFTQQTTDEEGHPLRDPSSSTYVSSFACAKDFGPLIRAEALRRGMALATTVVLLGDGAAWIWEIARTCFPFAVQIVDFYHALEHLSALTNLLFGTQSALSKEYQARWRAYLEVDQIAALIQEANTWILQLGCDAKAAGKALGYFENNQSRMLYGTFREKGYFIGSGVVEAGCKTVIGRRVKQSGMLWSLTGAGKVLAIRCAVTNNDFDGFWGQRRTSSELKAAA